MGAADPGGRLSGGLGGRLLSSIISDTGCVGGAAHAGGPAVADRLADPIGYPHAGAHVSTG